MVITLGAINKRNVKERYSTGKKLGSETMTGDKGSRNINYPSYYQLDHISNWTSISKFAVYGSHEAYYSTTYGVYTKNTYKYSDDL